MILPPNYPYSDVEIESTKRVGVSAETWKKWMLQLRTFLLVSRSACISVFTYFSRWPRFLLSKRYTHVFNLWKMYLCKMSKILQNRMSINSVAFVVNGKRICKMILVCTWFGKSSWDLYLLRIVTKIDQIATNHLFTYGHRLMPLNWRSRTFALVYHKTYI